MTISFERAIEEDTGFILSPYCSTEIRGYYTDNRVDRDTVPDGWNVYEFREGDTGNLCTLEEHVLVNFGGSFLTTQEVPMNSMGHRCLCGRGGYTFVE